MTFVSYVRRSSTTEAPTMGKLAMVITTTTQPGKRAEVHDLYRKVMAPRAELNAGQEVVVWCDHADDPDRFSLFEIYVDPETFAANAQAPWFAEYMAAVTPLLAAEPDVVMMSPAWAKGVSV